MTPTLSVLLWSPALAPLACAAPPAPAVPPAICGDRPGCGVAEVHEAGTDPDGAPLRVVEVTLPHGAPGPEGRPLPCAPRELWLVRGTMPPLRLELLCNDGYGASGVGEDSVSVGPNRLVHGRYGGSAWRWDETRSWQLAPLSLVATAQSSFHATASDHKSETSMDRRSGRWTTRWTGPACAHPSGAFDHIPDSGAAVVPATTALGSCAAQADAAGGRGYVVHGAPGAAEDAALWVTASGGNTLTVDVVDDVFVPLAPGASWLHADHLELWLAPERPDGSMDWDCPAVGASQWAVLFDGTVVAAREGSGLAAPTARAVDGGPPGRQRLVITLPPGAEGVTVVHSDSDDGQRQERLIATSALRFGDGRSLGQRGPLTDATCQSISGVWTLVDRWSPAP